MERKLIDKVLQVQGMTGADSERKIKNAAPAGISAAAMGKTGGASGKSVDKILKIDGMTCTSCEMRIKHGLKKLNGVINVKVSYSGSQAHVTYNPDLVTFEAIVEAIERLDYKVREKEGMKARYSGHKDNNAANDKMSINQLIGIGIIILAAYVIIKNTVGFNFLPQIDQNMGYGVLFVAGLITSLHCIAMCGGINLSQCVSYKFADGETGKIARLKPSLLYNTGRVISYTIIGGIVGALGSVISFSGIAKGIVAIISGIFMVIMGLNMLNVFPWLRKFNPRMPKILGSKVHSNNGKHGPFYVGLLNGLMPCGPLQAMQIYALGTGSFFAGALSMFMFSLGTVPLMFGFGAVSSFLNGKFTHRMMKVSAMLVMVLGVIMLNRGLSLSGMNVAYTASGSSASGNIAKIEGNVQTVTTNLESGKYTPIVVQKGIPVKWDMKAAASNINGCNGTITIPKYNVQKKLVPGDNIIEFTADENGNISYTCWMGMITSNIMVVDDITKVTSSDAAVAAGSSSEAGISGGGCCGATPAGFENGKIPTDNIPVAQVKDGQQEATVTVNNQGYTPAVVVLQKGVKAKIKFNPEQLSGCNSVVVFPELQGQLDISQSDQTETPWLTPQQDFTFQCGMGMLHGYVKVVDDTSKVDLNAIKKEIQNYKPAGSAGSGGCCGK